MLTVMFIQAVAARVSANPTDLQCLNLLTLQGPMTPSRLAEAMAITKGGAITAMVDRLEKAGYVRRTRDPRDRRQVLVDTVDDAPLRQLVARFSPIGERLTGLLAHYTDEELEVILDFAARSNDAVRRHL
jgi:DNA-binding MarR family transcriptional regulator